MNSLATDSTSGPTRHLRIALVLSVAGAVAGVLLMPYLFALIPNLAAKIKVALPIFVVAQVMQGGLLIGLLAWIGLRLGYAHGLDSPWLRQRLYGTGTRPASRWSFATALGFASGIVVLLLERAVSPLVPKSLLSSVPAWWQGLLASFYGGVVEEIVCRLFLVSLLVWIMSRIFSRAGASENRVYWIAIVVAAVLFGASHLPTLARIAPLSVVNVSATIALNAVVGIVSGWLFWRRGLEHAMLGHFGADIGLHVLPPLFMPH